jgi:hypothetical protein
MKQSYCMEDQKKLTIAAPTVFGKNLTTDPSFALEFKLVWNTNI